jgi:Xaa-Pro aminopeptidase
MTAPAGAGSARAGRYHRAMSTSINDDAAAWASPLARATEALAVAEADALLIGPGADLRYLTGYHAIEMERMTLLVLRADGRHTLIVPTLERPRALAAGLPDDLDVMDLGETDDPFAAAVTALGGSGRWRLGVGDRLWSRFLLGLQDALPAASWFLASEVTAELRMVKSPAELDALRRAGAAIDRVHLRMHEWLRPGRTEREVGRDIADAIVAEGHDEVAFVIVAAGANGASPHHETGSRIVEEGDAVVVDIGGFVDGYASDCTRDYLVGAAPEGYAEAHAALEAAQKAACDAVGPGVTAESVDAAARSVLTDAGFGSYFIHRLGHGIGLEVHEDPYMVEGNTRMLEPGMTFSVEPGIYLEGRFGMRIEDIVAVTENGVERLNTTRRQARQVLP